MKIYRIQNENGEGMYRDPYRAGQELMGEVSTPRHPSPGCDSKLSKFWGALDCDEAMKYYFGFDSISQLRNWVYDDFWFDQLAEKGFHVYEVTVRKNYVKQGNTQAIFKREKASKQRKMTIEEVLK